MERCGEKVWKAGKLQFKLIGWFYLVSNFGRHRSSFRMAEEPNPIDGRLSSLCDYLYRSEVAEVFRTTQKFYERERSAMNVRTSEGRASSARLRCGSESSSRSEQAAMSASRVVE